MSIKIVKLVSGEEIIGEVVEENQNGVELKNTLALVLSPTREGLSYSFIPWGSMGEGNKKLKNEHIIYDVVPKDELLDNYRSMFSGIVTPSKKLVI